ncbi:MAG: hypothetical protein D3905_12650 [Candidatus Electrothrix sp. AS4_5]|nr:hypothetical protein [Candidatus Electrothrix gigas]
MLQVSLSRDAQGMSNGVQGLSRCRLMVKGVKDDRVWEAISHWASYRTGSQRGLAHAPWCADGNHLVRVQVLVQPGEFVLPVEEDVVLGRKEAAGYRPGSWVVICYVNIPACGHVLIAVDGLGGGAIVVHLLAHRIIALGNVLVSVALVVESVVLHHCHLSCLEYV